MSEPPIHLLQERDFSELYSDTFRFLRTNFSHFFKCVVYIAGPFILLAAIVGTYSQTSQMASIDLTNFSANPFGPNYWLLMGATIFIRVIASIVLIGVVIQYFRLYAEKGAKNFELPDVSNLVLRDFGRLIKAFFLMFLLIVLVFFVIAFVIGTISAILPPLGIFLIIALFVLGLIFGPPLLLIINSTYMAVILERKDFSSSVYRARQLVKENFWPSWVVVFVALIMVIIAGTIFSIPAAVVQIGSVFTSLNGETAEVSMLSMVLIAIGDFMNTILYSVMIVIMGFQYYSLAEKKDGQGLMSRIDDLGTGQDYRDQNTSEIQ